jgi:glycyl-tRNA synthetase (class II)
VDYDSLNDATVTVRDRDTRSQERVKIEELAAKVSALAGYPPIFP